MTKPGKLLTIPSQDTVNDPTLKSLDNLILAKKTAPLQSNNLARDGKMGKAA